MICFSFRTFLEELQQAVAQQPPQMSPGEFHDTPFQAGGKNYILRMVGYPTWKVIHSRYKKGEIYEIVWFPAELVDSDAKYDRQGGNSVGDIRELIRVVAQLLKQNIDTLNPTGFYFKGADEDLDRLWKMFVPRMLQLFNNYDKSAIKPNVFVRKDIKQIIDQPDTEDDY